jgi:Holliday junction resolvase-like predicted endonuclease
MYESFITKNGKMMKIFNLREITSPWAWENSLERAYEAKRRKYLPVAMTFHQNHPEYQEVRLNVIVVSPSGVF